MPNQSIFLKTNDNSPAAGEPTPVDAFLTAKTGRVFGAGGRLIFVLDATASRAPMWDMARGLTGDMIREAATIGRLAMQLVFFSGGTGAPSRCSASDWLPDPVRFAQLMAKVTCEAGYTQISRALAHAKAETAREKVGAVVLIGDACEPVLDNVDQIALAAQALKQLKTPVFAFLEGRDPQAEMGFRKIAELSGGAFGRFDAGGVRQVGELLKAAALFAVGGMLALRGRKDAGSLLLLEQLKGQE